MGGIRFEAIGPVAVVGLDSPPFHPLDRAMVRRLGELLVQCAQDDALRVLVIHGTGDKAFSAGSDLAELRTLIAHGPDALAAKFAQDESVFGALARFPKPTIAAVEGAAMGGGLELAVCCDWIVASRAARFGLPEVKLGVFPGSGGTVRVTRRIGDGRARQMMLLGDPIDADTAERWGLVNQLCEPGQALGDARRLAVRLARGPALAMQLCKQALDAASEHGEQEALALARRHAVDLGASADLAEGLRAFDEKRHPRFGASKIHRPPDA
ncbi:putative enoyl-CoA hydratase echA8 (plasmid) [Variovorax sp. SRS16]|uniref:enoyl-CoA hydratase/isomerase family protein n=1 Tax=Variovorax sp. SRS16 TaxID=282217 RepID=UPI0013169E72|nr:enoyl-CoA hydratase/isomerase family protein [Variovorax sp. SRS16]VTU46729.1 putative enoyl-CoA hydratase echA8 [Variovorax sp. SRS16]